MLRVFVEEAAALASIGLFVGMIAIWAQVIPNLCSPISKGFEPGFGDDRRAEAGPFGPLGEKPDSGGRGSKASWT